MFGMPDVNESLTQFDLRLDKLDQDMNQMITILKHIDKTLTKQLQAQLGSTNGFNTGDE